MAEVKVGQRGFERLKVTVPVQEKAVTKRKKKDC